MIRLWYSDGFKGAPHSICVSIPPRVTWIISRKAVYEVNIAALNDQDLDKKLPHSHCSLLILFSHSRLANLHLSFSSLWRVLLFQNNLSNIQVCLQCPTYYSTSKRIFYNACASLFFLLFAIFFNHTFSYCYKEKNTKKRKSGSDFSSSLFTSRCHFRSHPHSPGPTLLAIPPRSSSKQTLSV